MYRQAEYKQAEYKQAKRYSRRPARSPRGCLEQTVARNSANQCAQCGEAIHMPEWSEWLNAACARHLWRCEACGYSFETTVHFAAA